MCEQRAQRGEPRGRPAGPEVLAEVIDGLLRADPGEGAARARATGRAARAAAQFGGEALPCLVAAAGCLAEQQAHLLARLRIRRYATRVEERRLQRGMIELQHRAAYHAATALGRAAAATSAADSAAAPVAAASVAAAAGTTAQKQRGWRWCQRRRLRLQPWAPAP